MDLDKSKKITNYDYLIIGLFMVSCYIGNLGQYTIMSQYIYHRIAIEKGFQRNKNYSHCSIDNTNYSEVQNQIQSSAAKYNIYAQISCGVPSIIAVIFCGILSDLFGRKLVILLSWIGGFFGTIFNILLIALNGPLWLYILGQFLSGLGGSYGAMLVGIFSLVSDSTGYHNRNFGIIIIEITLGISMIVSQALLGKWLKYNDFLWPIVTFSLLFMLSGVVWFFIKETRVRQTDNHYSLKSYARAVFSKMIRLFYISSKCNSLLIFCIISFFIHTFNFFGNLSLITVYLFGKPFCWDSEMLGYYRSISSAIVQLGIFISYFMLKYNTNEILIVEIGFLTNILSKLLFAIAPGFGKSVGDYLIDIGLLDLFSGASVSLLRSISSKLVSSEEYGTLFGVLSSFETLGSLFGGVTYNAIYEISFHFYYGFCYFVAVFLLSVAFAMMIFYYVIKRKSGGIQYQDLGSSTIT